MPSFAKIKPSRKFSHLQYILLSNNRFQLIFYFSGSTENVEAVDGNNPDQGPPSPEKQIQHRANTTMHVCWHRNTSVSKRDFEKAVKVTIFRVSHGPRFI